MVIDVDNAVELIRSSAYKRDVNNIYSPSAVPGDSDNKKLERLGRAVLERMHLIELNRDCIPLPYRSVSAPSLSATATAPSL